MENNNIEEEFEFEEEEAIEYEGIDKYFYLKSNFLPHFSLGKQSQLQEFQIIPSPIKDTILQSSSGEYNVGQFIQSDKIPTQQIRWQLNLDNNLTDKLAEIIAGRQSLLLTSGKFQNRVQTREAFSKAVVGYLLQLYFRRIAYNDSIIQEKLKQIYDNQGFSNTELANNDEPELEILQKADKLYTYGIPGVLVITETAHQAWRVNQSIMCCIPDLLEKNIKNRTKLEKYAPLDTEEIFKVSGRQLLPDEIPDIEIDKINLQKPAQFYQNKVGSQTQKFLFGINFARAANKLEAMCRIRKADVLFGSIQSIIDYGKVNTEEDYSFLSGIHTVYIENLDKIAISDFTQLKTVLGLIGRRPKLIKEIDLTCLTSPALNFSPVRSIQFIATQQTENEYSNSLFDPSLSQSGFDTCEDTPYDHAEVAIDLQKEGNCARNSLGILKLNFTTLKSIFELDTRILIQKIDVLQHINIRRTENLPDGFIKLDLTKHPKIDFLVNQELQEIENFTVVLVPDSMSYQRVQHVFEKLKIKNFSLNLETDAEDAKKTLKSFKKGLRPVLLLDEQFVSQSYPVITKIDKLVALSPPREQEVFKFLFKNSSEYSRIYWNDDDLVRWSGLVDQDTLDKIIKNRVVYM